MHALGQDDETSHVDDINPASETLGILNYILKYIVKVRTPMESSDEQCESRITRSFWMAASDTALGFSEASGSEMVWRLKCVPGLKLVSPSVNVNQPSRKRHG